MNKIKLSSHNNDSRSARRAMSFFTTGMKNEKGFTRTLKFSVSSQSERGFTLLVAIITTSLLLLVSFVVINVALKQLILSYANQESQYAFYNADSGTECALYWDIKNPGGTSAFATGTASTISCNTQSITSGQSVPTSPSPTTSVVGGGGSSNATSTFSINFPRGCAIVKVGKTSTNTRIESYGYNTCNTSANRRFERGITVFYAGSGGSGSPPPPPPPPPGGIPTDAIGWWKFDGNANDSSGNGFNGSPVGGPTYVAGQVSQALSFNGSNQYVDVGNLGNVNTAEMSISLWIKYNSLPGGWTSVLGKGISGSTDEFQYDIGDNGSGGSISLNTSSASGQTTGLCSVSLSGKTGIWMHYAFVWSADSDWCKVYENGALLLSENPTIHMNPSAGFPLYIGVGYGDPTNGSPDTIDAVRIFTRALTPAEVSAIYNE